MGTTLQRDISGKLLFPEVIVADMFSKIKGHSSLAALSAQTPIAFNGQREFTFSLDKEVDIVAENGAKGVGGATITPVTIIPVKFEYGMRVSDEFRMGSDEVRLNYISAFADGFAKKMAKGIDLAAFHGINPRTNAASAVVGKNNFDELVKKTVTYSDKTKTDDTIEDAVAVIQEQEGNVNGLAIAPSFAADLSKIKVNGVRQYPEFAFGRNPGSFAGMNTDVNITVSGGGSSDVAIIGDFQNAFKWGYAKTIPLEVIEYGNPDNDEKLGDLKGHNQIYLRAEAYVGWGILDASSFARIVTPPSTVEQE